MSLADRSKLVLLSRFNCIDMVSIIIINITTTNVVVLLVIRAHLFTILDIRLQN